MVVSPSVVFHSQINFCGICLTMLYLQAPKVNYGTIIHQELIIRTPINGLARIKSGLAMSKLVLPFTVQVILLSTVMKRVCLKGGHGIHIAHHFRVK